MPFVIWRNRTTTWFAVVLMVAGAIGARNVAIEGKGTIDGRGYVHRKKPKDPRRWRDVLFYRCRDIRVEDVRLRNSALWTC